jgi:hypothetical protein
MRLAWPEKASLVVFGLILDPAFPGHKLLRGLSTTRGSDLRDR